MNNDEVMDYIYYKKLIVDNFNNFYNNVKTMRPNLKKQEILNYWNSKISNQVNKAPKLEKKVFMPIYAQTQYSFQVDLTFMPMYKKQNNNYEILFTAININTRFVYYYPMKNKEMNTIIEIFDKLQDRTIINSITGDGDFDKITFKNYCEKHNINLYIVINDSHKLGIINRFHRTLKEKLNKYFMAMNTTKWIDVMDTIIFNYNNTRHSSIKMKPVEMNNFLEHEYILYKQNETNLLSNYIDNSFKIGDTVRIKIKTNIFDKKSITNKYSDEIYKVIKVYKNALLLEYNNNQYRVKKDDVLIVNNNVIQQPQNNIIKAKKEYKIERNLNKVGIEPNNVIETKRERKPKVIYDL